jgi:hypothetical protein
MVPYFVCDICSRSSSIKKDVKGWLEISVEDHFEDRMWHDKAICPMCVELIIAGQKKKEKHITEKFVHEP